MSGVSSGRGSGVKAGVGGGSGGSGASSRAGSSLGAGEGSEELTRPLTPQHTPTHETAEHAQQTAAIYRQLMAAAAGGHFPGAHGPLHDRAMSIAAQPNKGPGGGGEREGSPSQPGSVAFTRQMELARAKLKATSRTSALLSGFAMVALVELDYGNATKNLLVPFGVVTTCLVSVHLLALMMSTCILPHLETSSSRDSPHVRVKWYIEMSWFFSTCLGLLLFLLEICIVFWIKFIEAGYPQAAYVTTAILIPVFILFIVFTYTFYRKLMIHKVEHMTTQLDELQMMMDQMEQGGVSTPNNAAYAKNRATIF